MCVSFFIFFIFLLFSLFFYFYFFFYRRSKLPLYFPLEGEGREDGILWLAFFLPIMAQILYIYLKRKKKCKEANERSLLHAWKLQEGREGRVLLECLTLVSLPPSHAHSPPPPPHRRQPGPSAQLPPPRGPAEGNPVGWGMSPGAEQPKGCNNVAHTPRECSVTLRHDAMVFWRTSALS